MSRLIFVCVSAVPTVTANSIGNISVHIVLGKLADFHVSRNKYRGAWWLSGSVRLEVEESGDRDPPAIQCTVKSLLEAWASVRIISFHRDGDWPLLEATSVTKVKLQFIGKGRHLEMLVSRSP